MRKLLWTLLLFVIYVWIVSSGHDQFVVQQGKNVFKSLVSWFDDAEVDFQLDHKPVKQKKKSRRWD